MSHKEEFLARCLPLDSETNTNEHAIAEVVETGFCIREDNNWTIFQELHSTNNPIPPKVASICYITNEMTNDKPYFSEYKDVFQAVVDGYVGGYLVAHNAFFDSRVFTNNGINTKSHSWICTWRLSKKLFQSDESIEETNQPYLRFALNLDVPIDMHCHRAGNDAYVTAKLLESLVDIMVERGIIDTSLPYGPQVYDYSKELIIYETMPFGKHKGIPMKQVPKNYWSWAMHNTDWFNEDAPGFDADLFESISLALD